MQLVSDCTLGAVMHIKAYFERYFNYTFNQNKDCVQSRLSRQRWWWVSFVLPTCEEPEGWLRLGAHDLDPAEEGEGDAVRGLGERLDVAAGPGLRVAELSAGEGQHVEVRGAQLPVQLLQSPVVRLRLLAVTRHVYNQRRLHGGDQDRGDSQNTEKTTPP